MQSDMSELENFVRAGLRETRRIASTVLQNSKLSIKTNKRVTYIVDTADGGWSAAEKSIEYPTLRTRELTEKIRHSLADDDVARYSLTLLTDCLLRLFKEDIEDTTIVDFDDHKSFLVFEFVYPVILGYAASLEDPSTANESKVQEVIDIFKHVAGNKFTPTAVLRLAGMSVEDPLEVDMITLRKLDPIERGSIYNKNKRAPFTDDYLLGGINHTHAHIPPIQDQPTVLMKISYTKSGNDFNQYIAKLCSVLMAFRILGYEIKAEGYFSLYLFGFEDYLTGVPINLEDHGRTNISHKSRKLTVAGLLEVATTADAIFGMAISEPKSNNIIATRAFKGLLSSSLEKGFLDRVIALEAILLNGEKTESIFKFSMFGAAYLSDINARADTFEKFKNIYAMRSNLIHGADIKKKKLLEKAYLDSDELLVRVLKKVALEGRPQPSDLINALLPYRE